MWTAGVSAPSALGIPGPPPYALLEQPPVSDSWALTFHESTTAGANLYWTELGLLALPWHQHGQESDKTISSFVPYGVFDTWFLQWNETPFDTIQYDLWDIWRLTYSTESGVAGVNQTFAPSDLWSISFVEVSSLSVSTSTVTVTPNDLWSLTQIEASALFETLPTTDTWSISYSAGEVSALLAVPASASVDTWSISFSAGEVSAVVASGAFVVNTTDTWSLTQSEASAITSTFFLGTADLWSLSATDVSQLVVNATLATVDTWSLVWNEVSDLRPTPMFTDIVDTWRLSVVTEAGSAANVPTIPIFISDQWTLTWVESGLNLLKQQTQPPGGRRINVGRTPRKIIVEV